MSLSPLDAMRAAFAAWEARDPAALAALFAPDGQFLDPLKPGVLTGPADIEAGNRDAMAAVEDVQVTIEHGFEDGSHGAVEGMFLSRVAGTDIRFDFAVHGLDRAARRRPDRPPRRVLRHAAADPVTT